MGSRLIRGEALANDPLPWIAPEVRGVPARGRPGSAAEEEAELERIRREARQQGFDQGHAEGLEVAAQDIIQQRQALERVLQALTRPMEELDHRVEEELVALVTAVARQLVRRELRMDPSHLVAVVREGLAALPISAEEIVVRVHPEDAAVLRECMGREDDDRPWRIQADPAMEPGGCQIVSAASQVDGRLETRLGRVIATMFEDARGDDE